MARKLRVEIEGDSKSGRKALDDVADEADKAARATDDLAGEFRAAAKDGAKLEGSLKDVGGTAKEVRESVFVLGRQTDKTAAQFREAARAVEKFDVAIAASRAEIAKLNKEFAAGGDVEVAKKLAKQYGELDKLSKLKKRVQKDDEDGFKRARAAEAEAAKAAKASRNIFRRLLGGASGAATGVGSSAADALGEIPGGKLALGVGVGATAIAAAPAVGAAAGGALLAGGALGGVGLGVAGAIANNPEPFQRAWTDAIQSISKRWQDASTGFEKPSLDAFATIKNAIDGIDLEGPLKDAAKYVEPLARGISGLVSGIGKGFGGLISKAGPVVDVLAKRLPEIGKAFDIAFNRIGDSSEGAAAALDDVLRLVRNVVVGVGEVVGFLSDVYGKSVEIRKNVEGFLGIDIFGDQDSMLQTYGRSLDGAKGSTFDMVEAQKQMAEAAKAARDALHAELDELLGLEGANDAAIIAQKNLKKSFEENGTALQGNSDAALANRENLRNLEQAYGDQWQKAVDAAHGSQDAINQANQAYLAHLQEVRAIAVAHGGNTTELDKYIEHVKRINGLSVDFYIYTHYKDIGTPSERRVTGESRSGGRDTFAAGGVMDTSGFKLVGEKGPEIVWGSQGQFVSTAEQTRRLVSQMAGGSSGGTPRAPAAPAMPPMSQLEQAFASVFMYLANRGLIQVPGRSVV